MPSFRLCAHFPHHSSLLLFDSSRMRASLPLLDASTPRMRCSLPFQRACSADYQAAAKGERRRRRRALRRAPSLREHLFSLGPRPPPDALPSPLRNGWDVSRMQMGRADSGASSSPAPLLHCFRPPPRESAPAIAASTSPVAHLPEELL